MDDPLPITHWLRQLQAGNHAATQPLWESYFAELVRLARGRLRGARRGMADEEDVALSAFDSFCQGVAHGRFPDLSDRNNLWDVLVTITARKAIDLAKHERRLKRGGGRVHGEAALGTDEGGGLDQVVGTEPTPAFAAQVAEECQRLLAALESDDHRSLAVWKMEGYKNAEIAQKLGRAEPTVERWLRHIRKCWEGEASP